MTRILILYYSHGGSVAEMAKYISRGVESIENCEGSLRTVPPVRATSDNIKLDIPEIFKMQEEMSITTQNILSMKRRLFSVFCPSL